MIRPIKILVQPAAPKIAFTSKGAPAKLPKYLILFFKLYQIIFSIDLGFFQYKSFKIKCIFKTVAVLQILCISISCIYSMQKNMDFVLTFWYGIFIIENLLNVFFLTLSAKDMTLYKFLNTLIAFDAELGVSSNNLGVNMLMVITLSATCRIIAIVTFCNLYHKYCISSWITQLLFMIPFLSLDINRFIYFFIFYSVYCRLNKLTDILKNTYTNIISCHYLYIYIVQNTSKVKSSFDKVFTMELIIVVPIIMVSIFNSLLVFKEGGIEVLAAMLMSYVTLFHTAIILFSAPLCANMLSYQTEQMKIVLHDILLEEKDKTRYKDLWRFIGYLEVCPFKLRACRIVPLDGSLLIIALNICVTYLIVIVQFTHLY